nr:Unknown Function [uncultured bacterium]
MSKYEPLRQFLKSKGLAEIRMTFADIERVLGFELPNSQRYAAWWSNNPTNNVMTNEWLEAGYRTEQVDIEGRKLVFRRVPSSGSRPADQAARDPATDLKPRRHPGFGLMKDVTTVASGIDLTAPTGGDWASSA